MNKYRGCSSIGRASALHAEGFAFKSRQLQLLCLRPTVGISTYPHEVENQVDYYTLVYRRYKWTKYPLRGSEGLEYSILKFIYYMMFDSVESFIIRQLLKNTSRLTCSTSCGYVDTNLIVHLYFSIPKV